MDKTDTDDFENDREMMDEPTFCGNYGRRCLHIFYHCDYHTDMGDALFHERRDRELEKE